MVAGCWLFVAGLGRSCVCSLPGCFAQILQKIGVRFGPPGSSGLNAKARLGSRACLDFSVSSILPN